MRQLLISRLICLAALTSGVTTQSFGQALPLGWSSSAKKNDGPVVPIGRDPSSSTATYTSLRLGVIFTDFAKKALDFTGQTRDRFKQGIFTNTTAMNELDPTYLPKTINESLKRRFKDVVVLDGFDDPQRAAIDAVMFLDLQITIGTHSGDHTHITIQGNFVDIGQKPIGHASGDGETVVGYPAWSAKFKAAADQAVERFAQALDGSKELANKLSTSMAPIAQVSAPLQPSPLPNSTNAARDGKRVALVVGNAAYRNVPRLANTANDARLVAETLKRIGFELVGGGPLLDLDRTGFVTAVASFGDKLTGNSVGVFYYAGHGLQMQGANYLVPVRRGRATGRRKHGATPDGGFRREAKGGNSRCLPQQSIWRPWPARRRRRAGADARTRRHADLIRHPTG